LLEGKVKVTERMNLEISSGSEWLEGKAIRKEGDNRINNDV